MLTRETKIATTSILLIFSYK